MKLSLLAYGIFTDCTAITPGSVTAQVVKLEQPHAPGHVGEVLRDLALLHNIIDDIDSEHHAADDQLDLAGIGHRSGPADGIFGLDLGEPDGAELLLIVDKTITELQAGVEDPGAAGPKETAEDGTVVFIIRDPGDILGDAAAQQRAQFSLQAAAGKNWVIGSGITNHRLVHCTDGGKRCAAADVHTGQQFQFTPNQNLSIHGRASSILSAAKIAVIGHQSLQVLGKADQLHPVLPDVFQVTDKMALVQECFDDRFPSALIEHPHHLDLVEAFLQQLGLGAQAFPVVYFVGQAQQIADLAGGNAKPAFIILARRTDGQHDPLRLIYEVAGSGMGSSSVPLHSRPAGRCCGGRLL